MMTVSEFSVKGGVPPHVIRFYSRIGLLTPARDPNNGYKLFSHPDISRLRFIRQAQSLGYTLDEIGEILLTCSHGQSPCARVRQILRERIKENRGKLDEMMALQQRMEHALASWEKIPDLDPQGESQCYLIESTETPPINA
jgi:MerR family Zn(II)-responsive transcriptional regulator of zntA